MSKNIGRWPEPHDFVAIDIKGVEYYGYVDDIDFDLRHPSVTVEFYPGCRREYDLAEIKFMDFPKPKA
jgi:hypothetical protein